MIFLKKFTYILLLQLAIVSLLILSGFKGGSGFTIEVDDSFAVATKISEVDEIAERLGIEREEAAAYFKQNDLKFIAVSEDTETQIRVSRFADDFSSVVYDAENLTEDQISEMISLYGGSEEKTEIIDSDGRKFAKTVEVLKDSGGIYACTQYVTVAGGRIYVITCYNPSDKTSEEVEKIFSTFTARDMTTRLESYKWQKKWIVPGVIATCAVVGVCVVGILKKLYEK